VDEVGKPVAYKLSISEEVSKISGVYHDSAGGRISATRLNLLKQQKVCFTRIVVREKIFNLRMRSTHLEGRINHAAT
jgi:hypothetical protein